MDFIHHTAIGGIGMATLVASGHEVAGAAFLAGSVAPDLDVLLVFLGKRTYWKHHQAASHSLWAAPLLALLITWPLFAIAANPLLLYAMALSGLFVHILLDWSNTFGINLFWPISKHRYTLDAVFLVDFWAWALTLFFIWRLSLFATPATTAAYGAAFALYVTCKILLHRKVCKELSCRAAIPSSVNPFTFYILEEQADGVRIFLYNWLRCKRWQERRYPLYRRRTETWRKRARCSGTWRKSPVICSSPA